MIPMLDKHLITLFGKPQSGWLNLENTTLSRADFFYKITNSKAALTSFTLVPGETTVIFLENLSKKYDLSYEKLYDVYLKSSPIKEGFLIPDTYTIPIGMNENEIIQYLIKHSKKIHKNIAYRNFKNYNMKDWKRYLIIASIVQKEAGNKDEMKVVSSVIYNRLKKGMKLQMDGALNYGKYSHIRVTPKRIKEDSTHYNTYKFKGLPKAPVAVVSKEAINAAINPATTKYLYFVKKPGGGSHLFSKSYKEHLKNIKLLK